MFFKKNKYESRGTEYLQERAKDKESEQPLEMVMEFLNEKKFLVKLKDYSDPLKFQWRIGELGRKTRKSIADHWKHKTSGSLSNIKYIDEIGEKLSVDYIIDILNKKEMEIPFGITRIINKKRDDFACKRVNFRDRDSDHIVFEYATVPSTSKDMMVSWIDFTVDFLNSIGIDTDDIEIEYEKYEDDPVSDHYYFDRFIIKNIYHFGTEAVCTVSSKIDFEFEHHDTRYFSEELKKKCFVKDDFRKTKGFPHIIEIKIDLDRLVCAVLLNNFRQERIRTNIVRTLNLTPQSAPVKCAVFPLSIIDKKTRIMSKKLTEILKDNFETVFDEKGTLDIRSEKFAEIGVPFYITAEPELIEDNYFTLIDNIAGKDSEVTEEDILRYINAKIKE